VNAPGFFPAITGFTDAITALPKEMIRHYTMLKEVDAKIYGPEEALKKTVSEALKMPVPPRRWQPHQHNDNESITGTNQSATTSINGAAMQFTLSQQAPPSQTDEQTQLEHPDLPRRKHFFHLREYMALNISALDEKIHVLTTATDALERQLSRCDSYWPGIENEINEETRYGNLNHWAYIDKTAERRIATAHERPRRDAAHSSSLGITSLGTEGDYASRSEARREALAHRKRNIQQIDSEFEDDRTGKRATGPGKGKKPSSSALGANGSLHANLSGIHKDKRRKIEKPNNAAGLGVSMERSISTVYGATAGSSRATVGSPRETPMQFENPRRKGRGGATANGNGRKR
jgi:Inhibitor of growth proteins N-terminal histone-binding